jgi:hypothetical protein
MTVRMGQLSLHRRLSAGRIARRFLPPFILAGYGIFILSLFARHEMSLYINPVYIGPTITNRNRLATMTVLAKSLQLTPAPTSCLASRCSLPSLCRLTASLPSPRINEARNSQVSPPSTARELFKGSVSRSIPGRSP